MRIENTHNSRAAAVAEARRMLSQYGDISGIRYQWKDTDLVRGGTAIEVRSDCGVLAVSVVLPAGTEWTHLLCTDYDLDGYGRSADNFLQHILAEAGSHTPTK